MSQLLKQSTAYTFRVGPFIDNVDGYTPETGLTLSQADFRLSKAGGAYAQKNDSTSGTHDENGWYTCVLNTTDTNTLGTLDIAIYESGALPVFTSFMVIPANVYNSLVGNIDVLESKIAFSNISGSMAESYASDGSAPTIQQVLIAIQQFLQEKTVAGTTMTIKKLDGVTTAMTFTLNDASSPTSLTRAS